MQTAEKVDSLFLLKLITLFVLLFIGVALKVSQPVLHAGAQPHNEPHNLQAPKQVDSAELQQLYFHIVRDDAFDDAAAM